MGRIAAVLAILVCSISCDQVSKNIAREKLEYYREVGVIGQYLTLTKIENTGAFLSMGTSLPVWAKMIVFVILPCLALVLSLGYVLMKRSLTRGTILGICFIVGGGIGNVYDRLVYGSVTDFLHIDFGFFETGIFNLADVSVSAGALLLMVSMFKEKSILADQAPQ